ncbi:helix-turn-helix domain-containing protein [Pontibacter flavimaris]|uniref:HTH cro/C1-type domain-containing protein n=1 Tax=Pontibacter flavimaris TaxID=1797110 RepID=A0A1Q5PDH6_9BACT|nr:helix-turn-helix transcriptional regulator [Pontibacter flavimaris]OKL40276.1 hypothetical protein A3841_18295 [Pontibacter flavimaris]
MDIKSTITRLETLIEHLQLSQNKFAAKLGTSSAMMSQVLKKDKNVGVDFFFKLLNAYPNLSSEWLFRGIGSMFLDEQANPIIAQVTQEAVQIPVRIDLKISINGKQVAL